MIFVKQLVGVGPRNSTVPAFFIGSVMDSPIKYSFRTRLHSEGSIGTVFSSLRWVKQ